MHRVRNVGNGTIDRRAGGGMSVVSGPSDMAKIGDDAERPRSAWDDERDVTNRDVEGALGSPQRLIEEAEAAARRVVDDVGVELEAVIDRTDVVEQAVDPVPDECPENPVK